jgi:hypothetical protein
MEMSVGVLDHYNVSTRKLEETMQFYEKCSEIRERPTPAIQLSWGLVV